MSPTMGTVCVQGRIAALLELGSGFNPQFTGRENVYLNGHLLGLTKKQIDDKFDYIAAFADIGEYIEQPVKTYSSGMLLRLAFAVQIAIETEVLIIDEALAVGDARFQLKCFKRLEEIKARGTTILFVSHATEMVRSFCDFGLVLNKGKAIYWGDAKQATVKYFEILFPEKTLQQENQQQDTQDQLRQENMTQNDVDSLIIDASNKQGGTFGVGGAELDWIKIMGLTKPNILQGGHPLRVCARFTWQEDIIQDFILNEGYEGNITLGIALIDRKGSPIFGCNGFDYGIPINCSDNNFSIVEFCLTLPHLLEGDYFLTVAIALGNLQHHIQLKWYDCMAQFKYLKTERNVFGIFAIDYEMKKHSAVEDLIYE
jgi:lipopolysaccharide transport system ATP-binding protein